MIKLNFKSSPVDSRDYILSTSASTSTSVSASTSTSVSVDLSNYFTSVKNQGSIGSCTAHSVIALMEYNYRKFTGDMKEDIFSERFTYYTTRVKIAGDSPSDDSGAYLRDTLKSMVKYGASPESLCKYSESFSSEPTPMSYQEASKYQALTYLSIPVGTNITERQNALNSMKTLLKSGHPFVGGFLCYSNLYNGTNGNILLPGENDKIIGGHAICIVGYDDKRSVLKFKNSWGASWGDRGYGYLPYEYILRGEFFDAWTIFTQENNNRSIGIINPVMASATLSKAIEEGLVAISKNEKPTIPDGITQSSKLNLQSFFTRIILMKSQIR